MSKTRHYSSRHAPTIDWNGFPRRAIHLDFHTMPDIQDVGRDFDPEGFAATLHRAHVDYITVFAKCNLGFAYYPTRVGIVHPSLKRDMLGPMVEACHRRGIRVAAYFNAGLDHENALRHRDWCKLTPKGEVYEMPKLWIFGSNFFRNMCFQSGYRDYLLAMIDEVLTDYPVDGLFLDCICKEFPCLGAECVEVMEQHGWDPGRPEDVQRCCAWVTESFMTEVSRLVARRCRRRRGFKLYFNGAGYPRQPTHLELEILPTGGWGYDYLPSAIRYARTLGKPYFTMTGRFHGSWGDFGGLRPDASLAFDCFNSLANGGSCSIGDHMHPRGALDPEVYRRIGDLFGRVQELEPWTFGARARTEIAVLDPSLSDNTPSAHPTSRQGAARMLMELKYQFDVCDGTADLRGYRLVILPDFVPVDARLHQKLQAFLKAGGCLISSGEAGLDPGKTAFALSEYSLKYGGPDPFNTLFFKPSHAIARDLPDLWTTIYQTGIVMTSRRGARSLARLALPYFNKWAWNWKHENYYVPPEKMARRPAVAQCGASIIHIAFPVFGAYFEHAVTAYKYLIRNCIERLMPNPLLQVPDLPSFAQATLTEHDGRRLVHLLAYVPELRGRQYQIIEEPIQLRNVRVGLRIDDAPVRQVYLAPSRQPLEYTLTDGYLWTTVPAVNGYQLVVTE